MRHSFVVCLYVGLVALLGSACGTEEPTTNGKGKFGGQVVVSGPLRGASISIDQLDPATGAVRVNVATTTTDDDGRFSADVGLANGILRATASGGSFVDLVSGATIQLDPTDKLSSLVRFDIDDMRDDILVSPVGHLVAARALYKLKDAGDLNKALTAATDRLHRHFGNVDWSSVRLVGLDKPATSPTEPIRAALVQAALSVLAQDIGNAAESSPQDVNVFTLTQRWAEDIGDPTLGAVFDGNDNNKRDTGTGLQLGACKPMPSQCSLPGGCDIGACRTLCDLYAGSPRALLAGAMTKVIQNNDPNNPNALNRTQLGISDTLAIARSINDNLDDDLFGAACIEQLDRLPPTITWLPPTPGDGGYARSTISVKVTAVDDTDASPRVSVVGYADADGDPNNSVAIAMVDTAAEPDGALVIQVRAADLSGNVGTTTRMFVVDNTPPELMVEPTGFLVDGATWWTATATPSLQGTVTDAAPVSVKAVINSVDVPATVTGGSWTLTIPPAMLDTAGTEVTLVAADAAGNQKTVVQRIRPDITAPELGFQASNVNDESGDQVTYSTDESLSHAHNGTPVDLSVGTGCPSITKYAYLLGSSSPMFVTELPSRNPIAYQLVSGDPGVGIVAGSTQYRVLRRETGGGSTVVLDWTSAGAGTPLGGGTALHGAQVLSDSVAELATKEATYDVQFRTTDRLARTSTVARCFALRLRAAPLHFTTSGPAENHPFALNALDLAPGAPYDQIAARLLNDSSAASLLDQFLVNGTTETVFLTVTVTKPSSVTASEQFTIRNYSESSSVSIKCPEDNPDPCIATAPFPSAGYTGSSSNNANTLLFPVKVYEVGGNGAIGGQVTCLGPCSPSQTTFTFAIPPRAAGGAARRFVAMTMIQQVTGLWPSDGTRPATAPFSDTSINGVRYTGQQQFSSTGCTSSAFVQGIMYCKQRTTRVQYRALTNVSLAINSDMYSDYATAATPDLSPMPAAPQASRGLGSWTKQEGTLP